MYLVYNSTSGAGLYTEPNAPSLTGLTGVGGIAIPANFTIGPYGCTVSNGTITNNAEPTPAAPSLAQQAYAAMLTGLALTLSGTLTLASTASPTDPTTQGKLAAGATTINTTGAFPGGATTYPMKDASGAWHTFNLSQYKAVAAAIAGFAATLDLIIDGNPLGAASLPVSSVSLTV